MDTAALKPCPFCGGSNLSDGAVSNTGGNVRHIWCKDCHTVGPWSHSGKGIDAIDAWNRRPDQLAKQIRPDLGSLLDGETRAKEFKW